MPGRRTKLNVVRADRIHLKKLTVEFSDFNPYENPDPPGCNWFSRPGEPR